MYLSKVIRATSGVVSLFCILEIRGKILEDEKNHCPALIKFCMLLLLELNVLGKAILLIISC